MQRQRQKGDIPTKQTKQTIMHNLTTQEGVEVSNRIGSLYYDYWFYKYGCRRRSVQKSHIMERFTMADYTGADFIEKEYEKIVKEFQKDYKALDNLFVVLVDKAELWRSDKDKYAFRYYFDNNGLLHHPTNDNIAKIYENLAVKCRNLFFDLYADNREKVNYFDYFYCGGFTMKIS